MSNRLREAESGRRPDTRIIEPVEQIRTVIHPQVPNGKMLHARYFLGAQRRAGPSKGGIRMTATVSLNEVTGLAMEMDVKTALIGVPFEVAEGWIRYDAVALKSTEKEILLRLHPWRAAAHRPEIYVPAPTWEPTSMIWAISATVSPIAGHNRSHGMLCHSKPSCSAASSAGARHG